MEVLGTESAFEVLAQAKALEKQGKKILHFEIGEPDFQTHPTILYAAIKALVENWTHYVPAPGVDTLREAICEYIERDRGFKVTPDMVVVTPGAKPIIFHSIMTTVDPGDEVILQDPGFPIYESVVLFAGGVPKPVPLLERNQFRMTPEQVNELVSKKTKLIIINSPNNPTGAVSTKEDIKGIAEIAHDNGIWILTDEVYSQHLYDAKFHSVAYLDHCQENTILLDGFSKTYAMTGWRLGYGVMNKDMAKKFTQMNINTISCTSAFSQVAAAAALRMDQKPFKEMVAEFRRRRDLIVRMLNEVKGFKCLKPEGAFYVYPSIEGTGKTSKEIKDILLNEVGVAALPGTAFGHTGIRNMRFSYANSYENIQSGMEKIKDKFGAA